LNNLAIIVGNSKFDKLPELECCLADIEAMKQLLEATQKYQEIVLIANLTAVDLKTALRSAVEKVASPKELFFYFTGHGHQNDSEFFYCATDFDDKIPNQTGISQEELHTLLKLASAELIVKVVDACNSGALLVKSSYLRSYQNKEGIRNLIQISSCLENQTSLTGEPLSQFTQSFIVSALKKLSGKVFYTDLIGVLRDAYQEDDDHTPFFVSQVTGREVLTCH
jgi:hypothetical protein